MLAHILFKIYRLTNRNRIDKSYLKSLLLKDLWVDYKTTIYENEEQIEKDLKVLKNFGLINEDGDNIVLNVEALEKFERILERDPLLNDDKTYYLAYLKKKMDEGLEAIIKGR